MTITLPLPSKTLSPNARRHWRVVAKQKRLSREVARMHVIANHRLEDRKAFLSCAHDKIQITPTFYHKTNRGRDEDNLIASLKAYLDGIADGLGVNDKGFALGPVKQMIDKTRPRVEIKIEKVTWEQKA